MLGAVTFCCASYKRELYEHCFTDTALVVRSAWNPSHLLLDFLLVCCFVFLRELTSQINEFYRNDTTFQPNQHSCAHKQHSDPPKQHKSLASLSMLSGVRAHGVLTAECCWLRALFPALSAAATAGPKVYSSSPRNFLPWSRSITFCLPGLSESALPDDEQQRFKAERQLTFEPPQNTFTVQAKAFHALRGCTCRCHLFFCFFAD